MGQAHRLFDTEDTKRFLLAGNARVTLVSKKTGARFTYRVRQSKDKRVHFVSLLTGSDNESSYTYMGMLREGKFAQTAKSPIEGTAPSVKAFFWFHDNLFIENRIVDTLEVWHEGKCGRCNRSLTVPESILNGIGPECMKFVCQGVLPL